ncbi:unnamed protein product [Arabidopsis lyrata]|uniref:Methyltransferase type 11 domain-containing protein n=1 Tax=Arabidopsis lyrata subsp. lyrata TaxID=81972 RepID=D7MIH3_ARALL|nr:hypothetical protein ARALYDRAFT_915924 [Arabidopsis lyrata subsp. lyrata]CAH8277306.1 unnamed protein product [Arabidopsis lyrata]
MDPFSTKRIHPWVSHLQEEVKYEKVVGHGLNAQELARNPRLDYFFVKDLNEDQKFEFEDKSFDAVYVLSVYSIYNNPIKCMTVNQNQFRKTAGDRRLRGDYNK